jgi:hypothetical protein
LCFCLAGGLYDRDAHQSQHVHDVFAFFLRDVGRSLLLFQGLGQIADLFRFFLLFGCLFFYFTPAQ